MPEAFKLLQVAKNESLVGMYAVCGKVHKTQNRQCSSFESCTQVSGVIAQQEAMIDDFRNSGDSQQDGGGSEDSEVVQKGAGVVGDSSCTGRPCWGASAVVRVHGKAGGVDGGNGVKHQGHCR